MTCQLNYSQVCKLFESIIRDSMVRYLEDNGLIRDSQHGFRKSRSCLSNLLSFMDKVSGYLDSGEPVDAIFSGHCQSVRQRLHVFPPYFYFRYSIYRLFLMIFEQLGTV